MSKKKVFLFILLISFLVVVGGYAVYSTLGNLGAFGLIRSAVRAPEEQKSEEATKEAEVTQTKISYQCEEGKTALDRLQSTASDVKIRQFSFGSQVIAVNKVEQGRGKFWLYTVDGKDATVAADLYTCQDDEKIKWELR